MGPRRSPDPSGARNRYRGIALSLAVVAVMLAGAIAGATALDVGPASETAMAQSTADATAVESCTVIDEPGHYELTGEIEGDGDSCLLIASDDVVLDGNGHAVVGNGTEHGVGLLVFNGTGDGTIREGPALTNVTVRNVEVRDWQRGVQMGQTLDEGPTATLENVTATGNGAGVSLYGTEGSHLGNVTVTDNERGGLLLWETTNVTAEGITASDNGATGISFADTVIDSSFSDVTATGNSGNGIHFSTVAVNNDVTDAYVADNEGAGVVFVDSSNNVVRDSTIVDNTGPGILADPSDADRISNVTVSGNQIAYQNGFSGVRYGVIADRLRLGSGVVASFDANVSSFDDAGNVPEPPHDASTAGPAANLTVSGEDGAEPRVTLTFPYTDEAVGNESTLSIVRYSDDNWRPVVETSVDTDNQTVTATVSESGVFVPVYADQSGPVSGNQSSFVVNATGDDEVVYGFIVEGQVETTSDTDLSTEDDEEQVEERSDGTTVVLGSTGTDGGDTFVVTGEIVKFATQPRDASVRLELNGEDVTDRLVDSEGT